MINKGIAFVAFTAIACVVFALGSYIGRTNHIEAQNRATAANCAATGGTPVVIYGDTEVLCVRQGKQGTDP